MKDPRYVIVAGGALVQFTVIGFLFAFSIFFAEIEKELGWSRTLISLGASISTLVMGTLAIYGGRLSDRLGPRIVLAATGLVFALGVALMSRMQAPWQYLVLFGFFVGIGLSTHDVVTLSTVARWFDKRRGIMTGVVKTGTAAGQVVLPPIAALLIAWVGWRAGMLTISVCSAVLLLVAAAMLRHPSETERSEVEAAPSAGMSYAEARQTRTFWTLCAIQFLFFPTLMTVPFHLAVHGQDLGMKPENAALLLSVLGGASVAGRLLIGAVADRIGGRNAYALALGGLMTSLGLYAVTTAPGALTGITALYGFSHGALFVVVSPTVARRFRMAA
ncbi:MAG: MFS transporter, partial [Pseudomonadota bacterium]